MMKMSEQYCYSDNNDGADPWHGREDSREIDVDLARDEYGDDATVYTGRLRLYEDPCDGYGGRILEWMAENAFDNCGEVAEDWPKLTKEEVKEFDAMIAARIRKWFADTGNEADFGAVVEIQKHEPMRNP
jgi:hypothetical protein